MIITGYYGKQNYGDDLFQQLAEQLFMGNSNILKTTNKIVPIDTLLSLNPNDIIGQDTLILFGGETLNNYFLDTLIRYKEKCEHLQNKAVRMIALGVSCNQTYNSIYNKIQIFSYIVFRSKKDYEALNAYVPSKYCPDIVFLLHNEARKMEMNTTTSTSRGSLWCFKKSHVETASLPETSLLNNTKMTTVTMPTTMTMTMTNTKAKTLTRKSSTTGLRGKVGFFLAATVVSSKTPAQQTKILETYLNYIRFWTNQKYIVELFAMCVNSSSEKENDFLLNKRLYQMLLTKEKPWVLVHLPDETNSQIIPRLIQLTYAVCFRYHAHILCIIHSIPFVSLSNTPKVVALLADNDLKTAASEASISDYINVSTLICKNSHNIKQQLQKVYQTCHKQATTTFRDITLYTIKDDSPSFRYFYINEPFIQMLIKYVTDKVVVVMSEDNCIVTTPDNMCKQILFHLLRTMKSEYAFGLTEKIRRLMTNTALNTALNTASSSFHVGLLKDDINWIINDCIAKHNLLLYDQIHFLLGDVVQERIRWSTLQKEYNLSICLKPNRSLNMKYFDQNIYQGLHRSGWNYVVTELEKLNSNLNKSILCDLYVDATFHWNLKENLGLQIVPYKQPWIGFIHHTCEEHYTLNNTTALFQNETFLTSLVQCQGLYVLSTDLKQHVLKKLAQVGNTKVKVTVLFHPTEFPIDLFTFKKFLQNPEKKVVQIGAWLRDLNAINELVLPSKANQFSLTKCVVIGKKMDEYYKTTHHLATSTDIEQVLCRDLNPRVTFLHRDVKKLTHLEDPMYDQLLCCNIVFIYLINGSATNTVIECIVRHTPIIVNRIPATVEYLGKDYPLFYDDVSQVTDLLTPTILKKGYKYLKKMNKDFLKMKCFITEFIKSINGD
jgi:hypothetical protein